MKSKNVRLSQNTLPIKYEIELRPDLENFTFQGLEKISLSILKKTSTLTLHSKELEIETAQVLIGKDPRHGGAGKVFAKKISYDGKAETATFEFPKSIPAGKTVLTLVFKGILNDKMRGFYKSSYIYEGKVHHMATTQFEATDARRAFPCFDEPAHKAVFHVSLVVPKGKTAISNALPISTREHEAGYEVIKFAPTPKMSTYLLAFIVGDFEYIEKKSKKGVAVRVYTVPGKKHQAGFALDVTVKCLEFYEEYFDIPYPLNTLDMIAIPDFASLAMENWGAITFREIGLLVDENKTSMGSKEMIAEVIAHELAHQWFGNLVTMEWWTHLWLNEGFASYIPYLVIDKLFPSWNIWERFNTQTLGIALRLDSLKNTHPIEVEVHHPDEIGEIFDEVSYSKGASVIRMLADYLGEKDFRDGLRYYLKKHSYKNTSTVHLWEAFEKISKKPIESMMKNWTGKPGYPVVKVIENNNQISFSQERFFISPASREKAKDKTIWQIPIVTKNKKFLMTPKKVFSAEPFEKINLGEGGFYRTAYSKELLEKLYEPVKNKTLPARDRLGIIRDLFALSEAGIIPTTDALSFLSSYKEEDNYTVWVEIATGIARLEQLLAKTKAKENLSKFVLSLFSGQMKKLGWDKKKNELYSDSLLRSLTIARLGRSGDKSVIATARGYFYGKKNIHPDIRGAVYAVVSSNGTKKDYETFISRYKKETLHEEKNRLGGSLADFPNAQILKSVCEFSMSKEVRTQDTMGVLSGVGANPLGRDIWLSFVKSNWETFVTRYGDGGHQLSRLVKAISASPEQKHLNSFKAFFKTHDAPGAQRSIEQVLERLEGNTLWLARDGKKIGAFLNGSTR